MMVQIVPLLHALSAVAQVTPQDVSPDCFVVRQIYNPSSLPPACQSPCDVTNTIYDCDLDLFCICGYSVGSELQQCMRCLVSADPTVQGAAQTDLDEWNEACGGSLSVRPSLSFTV
ncbi:hypothetical protein BS17DRAFT_285250 [Gyrodon lividus]|nr:hypothetical protein BS17DRAFT_285250 [Gyrodon lividus]